MTEMNGLNFDGSLSIPVGTADELGFVNASFTVEAWVRFDSVSGDHAIMGMYVHSANKTLVLMARDGKAYLAFYTNDTVGTIALQANVWTHLSWSYDLDTGTQAVYVNGVLDASNTGRAAFAGTDHVRIGHWNSYHMRGDIAEIRHWNYARTPEEIQRDMHRRMDGSETGLRNYWPLFQADRTAYNFNNTASIPIGNCDDLGLSGRSFTVEAWVKLNSISGDQFVLGSQHTGTNQDLYIMVRSGKADMGFYGTTIPGHTPLRVGQWYHLAWRFNVETSERATFFNGRLERSITGDTFSCNTLMEIGGYNSDRHMHGSISELRIWDHARSDDEIRRDKDRVLSGGEKGLTGYWPLNEGAGTAVANQLLDMGRAYNDLGWDEDLDNLPPLPHSHKPLVSEFNGKDQYLDLDGVAWPSGGPVTVELWAKIPSNGLKRSRLFNFTDADNANAFWLTLWHDQRLFWDYGNKDGSGRLALDFSSNLDQWVHLAVVSHGEGGDFQAIYVNGVLAVSDTSSDGPRIALSELVLGKGAAPGGHFLGWLSEFRVWRTARTAQQILADKDHRLNGDEGHLVGYWPLDGHLRNLVKTTAVIDGSGLWQTTPAPELNNQPQFATAWLPLNAVVNDKVENRMGDWCSVVGATAVNDLELGSVLVFNGTDGHVAVADAPAFQLGQYAVSLYFKPEALPPAGTEHFLAGKPGSGFQLSVNSEGVLTHRFYKTGAASPSQIQSQAGAALVGEWNHAVIRYDGQVVRIYTGGRNEVKRAAAGPLNPGSETLYVGGDPSTPGSFFNGRMAHVRFYSRAVPLYQIFDQLEADLSVDPPAAQDTGPALHLPLDGMANDQISDARGNSYGISGSPVVADDPRFGKVLTFDGVDDIMEIPEKASLHGAAYTLSLWIKPDSTPPREWQACFGFFNKGDFWIHNTGYVYHRFYDPAGTQTVINTQAGGINWGEWNHIAIVNDGAGAKTWLNGVLGASRVADGLPENGGVLFLGSKSLGNYHFKGAMAHARVYNRAMTAEEVEALRETDWNQLQHPNSLVMHLPLAEITGGKVADLGVGVPQGHTGHSVSGAPAVADDVNLGKSLYFNGESDFLEIPDQSGLGVYTMSVWIKHHGSMPVGWHGVAGKPGCNNQLWLNGTGYPSHRYHAPGNANAQLDSMAGQIRADQWHHLAVTNDGVTARTYVDGALVAHQPAGGEQVPNMGSFFLARSPNGEDAHYFKGWMAHLRLYNTVLEDAAIEAQMAGDWTTTETMEMVPKYFSGGFQEGARYFRFTDATRAAASNRITVEAWVKPTGSGLELHQYPAAGKCDGGAGWQLRAGSGDAGFLLHLDGAAVTLSAQGAAPLNQWTYLVGVYDGTTVILTANGQQVAAQAATGPVAHFVGDLALGASPNTDPSLQFSGELADVRVWQVSRTVQQISDAYQKRLAEMQGDKAFVIGSYHYGETLSTGASGALAIITVKSTMGDTFSLNFARTGTVLPAATADAAWYYFPQFQPMVDLLRNESGVRLTTQGNTVFLASSDFQFSV